MSPNGQGRSIFVATDLETEEIVGRHIPALRQAAPDTHYGSYGNVHQEVSVWRGHAFGVEPLFDDLERLPIEILLNFQGWIREGGCESELVDGHAELFVGFVQDRDVSAVAMSTDNLLKVAYWQQDDDVVLVAYNLPTPNRRSGVVDSILASRDVYLPALERALEAAEITYRWQFQDWI